MQQGLVAVDFVGQTPSLNTYVTGTLGGTFEWRPIANTNRLSAHSYGIAIDIVVSKSNYWEWEKNGSGAFVWKNEIPQATVDASRPRASRGAAAGTTTLGQRALNVRGSLGLRTQRLVTFTPREESGLGARGL